MAHLEIAFHENEMKTLSPGPSRAKRGDPKARKTDSWTGAL